MSSIVTAHYDSEDAITNVIEDLVATGIPRDWIVKDPEHSRVSVTVGSQAEPEVTEILNRHAPAEIHARPGD
jgi:hypothetical protein